MEVKNRSEKIKNQNEKTSLVDKPSQLTLKVDKRIYKIVKYIRSKTKYPLGRLTDFAFLFLFTEHFNDIILNGITVLDAYLEKHPDIKQKFYNLLEKVERDELFGEKDIEKFPIKFA